MNNTIYIESPVHDDVRRQRVLDGQIFVFMPRPSSLALCEFARQMLEEAFAPLDPREAQHALPVEQFVAIMVRVKPAFIHHPRSLALVGDLLGELRCDLERTYLDVPRLKAITHGGYLTAGIGYAYHPHRDTWYSAPFCQMNWWMPIYEIESESSMAFHPRYWTDPVRNGSAEFNYYEYNSDGRKNAAQHIKSDTRKQPKPEAPLELDPQFRLVCPPGGVLLFSGAQLHSTVPNVSGRTRFSIDFRSVHLDDLVAERGAPNIDSAAQGTSLRDFVRGTDRTRLPDEVIARYDSGVPSDGVLVFEPPVTP